LRVATNEFANKGYGNSSLNVIIKKAGVSKGGMYKYISSKSELYRYVIDYSLRELEQHFSKYNPTDVKSIKDFLLDYSEHEFNFYQNHSNFYKLHINVFINSDEKIDREIREELRHLPESFFHRLMASLDKDIGEKTINIYKWVLEGINKKYYRILLNNDNQEKLKYEYLSELSEYLELLKKITTQE
jgi:TetR/AcrR family transcriptional regulator